MKKENILTIIGIFFILLNIVALIINIRANTPYNLIWFCNHTAIILGLAFIFRSSFWTTAEVSIGLFPQLFWSLDFLSKIIFDKYIFGITNYMFAESYNLGLYILSWNHIFMLPIALIGLYYLGVNKDAWKGALVHGILLFLFSYIFSNGINLNCMQQSCIPFIPTNLTYQILWPILFFLLVVIPTNLLLYKLYERF